MRTKNRITAIITLQAFFRGCLARIRISPGRRAGRTAIQRVSDRCIDQFIEDYLLDLLVEIISRNRVTEDLSLYSEGNRLVFQIREDIVREVTREMAHYAVREATDMLVTRWGCVN